MSNNNNPLITEALTSADFKFRTKLLYSTELLGSINKLSYREYPAAGNSELLGLPHDIVQELQLRQISYTGTQLTNEIINQEVGREV